MPGKTKSISELRKELKAKTSQLTGLNLRLRKLAAKLAAVDRQIAVLTGGPQRRVRKRKGRIGKSLAEYICGVLTKAKGGMRARDVTAAVLQAGYRTKDKTFSKTVAKTLASDRRFKRVSRGVYKLAA